MKVLEILNTLQNLSSTISDSMSEKLKTDVNSLPLRDKLKLIDVQYTAVKNNNISYKHLIKTLGGAHGSS